MSAIFGIVRYDGAPVPRRDMERMGAVLAHRAPDGCNIRVDGPVGFGHGLMRVNSEDLYEAQPLHDHRAGVTLVADCRIDNREDLAVEFGLEAAVARNMPDSAFVMLAYNRWGAECAGHLVGDFAFAIWDQRLRRLLLARDHIGQRYVHYHNGKGFFAFATEIKALWALADVPRALDETQIGRLLLWDARHRNGTTIFADIFGVCGGTSLTLDGAGRLETKRYWKPQAAPVHVGRQKHYYVEAYRRILEEAVACRVRRLTKPPALFLSAGYDSAAIAGLCGPVLRAKDWKLTTISSVLPADYTGPHTDVRRWVEYCRRDMPHLDVRYFVRDPEALLADTSCATMASDGVPALQDHIIDPLCRIAAAAGARLVMDGLGGDITLNPREYGLIATLLVRGRLRPFVRELFAAKAARGSSLWRCLISEVVVPMAPRRAWRAYRDFRGDGPKLIWQFVKPDVARTMLQTGDANPLEYPPMRARVPVREVYAGALYRITGSARPHFANAAAMHGLDYSKPMYDKRVVEFGLAIPEEFQIVNGRARDLARRALADIYPAEYQTRGRLQDPFDPDFDETARTIRPRIEKEVQAMRHNACLENYVAMDALERAFQTSGPIDPTKMTVALRTVSIARYIRWFRGENQ